MKTGIRFKAILTLFPLILGSLTFIGVAAIFGARAGMIRLAMGSLSFKAEILQQYADNQWKMLETQGFQQDPDFRKAVTLSISEYARSLLRDDTEWITAIGLGGQKGFSVSRTPLTSDVEAAVREEMIVGKTGPIEFGESDMERYGQAFYFEPLEWYIVVSNSKKAIFAETNRATVTILWGFAISLSLALVLLIAITGRIVKPIQQVSEGMTEIITTNRFDLRIPVKGSDEVGRLTLQFNALCFELDRSYSRIHDIALREIQARYEIADRERQAIIAIGKVSEFRDEETASHTIRSGLYSKILADLFFKDAEDRRSIFYAAPLHDIGKIGIPDSILLKPARLTPEEFKKMQNHTIIGHNILKEFKTPALAMGAEIALSHHERFDGTGYPQGLTGMAIPLSGRILAIVDVFDAMTSERPYKEAWHPDRAFEYIDENRGSHFDPQIVEAFLDKKAEILEIMERNR